RSRDRSAGRKQREALHHVAEAVRHFTERELVYLLESSRSWEGIPLRVGRVRLGCTSIRIELCSSGDGAAAVWARFEEQTCALRACIERRGWPGGLSEKPRRAFAAAVAGWHQVAAASAKCDQSEIGSTPITWEEWLDAWARDQRGEELPESLVGAK